MSDYPATAPAPPWPDRWRARVARFGNLALALLLAGLAARLVELAGVGLVGEFTPEFANVVGRAFWSDLLFFLQLLPFLLIPFLLAGLLPGANRAGFWCAGVIGSLALAAYLGLINYFFTTRVPLGADLFGYSPSEIALTVTAGYHLSLLTVVSFLVPLAVFWSALALGRGRAPLPPAAVAGAALLGAVLVVGGSALPPDTAFATEYARSVALNKAAFFVADTAAWLRPRAPLVAAAPSANATAPAPAGGEFTYLDPEYPFLRTDATPDALGSWFTIVPNRPPNLVIIQVEGLGRAFSGPHAYLGSFTPFLDELAAQGLYWENFLAAQGRTFAVLPSILGSLPYAEKGFNHLGARMPHHLTLFSILKRNGYRTGFYCGVDLDFDDQRAFLARQQTDVMIGINDYGAGYRKTPGSGWGYPDRELMRKVLALQPPDPPAPFADYVQTMSMHTSYKVPGQAEYLRRFEARMEELGFTETRKEQHRSYRDIYSTILYTDAALRHYFEEQAKRPAQRNTIYLVTGDHRLPEIPMATKIDRYHVPLIIWSPLLKRAASFKSISSHLDLTPSLLAFLKHNYGLQTPAEVAWVGSGLDLEPSLRNLHHYPLKHTKHNLIDYLSGLFFLNEETLFAINNNMDLEPIENEAKRGELRAEFDRYRIMNDRFRRELKLIPESVYAAFFPAH